MSAYAIIERMSEHPIGDEIVGLLKESECWYEAFAHDLVFTSEEAAAVRTGYVISQGAKSMIVRIKSPQIGKKFMMLVLPGDMKIDSTKVKKHLGIKDLRFASEEEVDNLTKGVKSGGVPPFGNLFGLEVIADPKILDWDKIVFNAGRNYSIGVKSVDYQKLVNPKIVQIT